MHLRQMEDPVVDLVANLELDDASSASSAASSSHASSSAGPSLEEAEKMYSSMFPELGKPASSRGQLSGGVWDKVSHRVPARTADEWFFFFFPPPQVMSAPRRAPAEKPTAKAAGGPAGPSYKLRETLPLAAADVDPTVRNLARLLGSLSEGGVSVEVVERAGGYNVIVQANSAEALAEVKKKIRQRAIRREDVKFHVPQEFRAAVSKARQSINASSGAFLNVRTQGTAASVAHFGCSSDERRDVRGDHDLGRRHLGAACPPRAAGAPARARAPLVSRSCSCF